MEENKSGIRWSVSPHARATCDADGGVLLDIEKGLCYSLNLVGAKIWQAIETRDGQSTFEDIVEATASQFSVRKNEAVTQEYLPEQKLTIDQATAGYTEGAAHVEFAEQRKGKLLPGYLADFVVLDRDVAQVPREQILKTKVLCTVVRGKTVWRSVE